MENKVLINYGAEIYALKELLITTPELKEKFEAIRDKKLLEIKEVLENITNKDTE